MAEALKPQGFKTLEESCLIPALSEIIGGVAERLNAPVLKTGVPEMVPGVQIPPPPLSYGVEKNCSIRKDTGGSNPSPAADTHNKNKWT